MSKFIQNIFFYPSTFPLPTEQKGKNKIFSIIPLFYHLTIFYSPTFPPLQPNEPLEFWGRFDVINYPWSCKEWFSLAIIKILEFFIVLSRLFVIAES